MWLLARLLAASTLAQAAMSKRGLCFTPNENHPEDNQVWVRPGKRPEMVLQLPESPLPGLCWSGPGRARVCSDDVGPQLRSQRHNLPRPIQEARGRGRKIQHVLAFNEPDAVSSVGGSNIQPRHAAQAWVANFEPLGRMGIKLGLPACTGGNGGLPWLKQFLGNCSELVSTAGESKNCTWDFLPVHWYDNFAGLAFHIRERKATWPDAEIWVTEYAYAHQDFGPTQDFFRQTVYFDKLDYIGRYLYFGAFRADKANVGLNAAFLNNEGQLTDIGSWYLGFGATGLSPQSGKASTAVPSARLTGGLVFAALVAACVS